MSDGDSMLCSYFSGFEEWVDDVRAAGLFSSFTGSVEDMLSLWEAKIRFWKRAIYFAVPRKLVGNTSLFVFTSNNLPFYFQRGGVHPLGLDFVLENMAKTREIISYDDYQAKGFSGLLFRIRQSLLTAIRSVFQQEGSSTQKSYIILALLEEAAQALINRKIDEIHEFSDACVGMDEFERLVIGACKDLGWASPSRQDIQAILDYISTSPRFVVQQYAGKYVVIFSSLIRQPVPGMVEAAKSIANIKNIMSRMTRQLSGVYEKIDAYERELLENVGKNRQRCIHILRKKKIAESLSDMLMSSLGNLEKTLCAIKAIEGKDEIVKAYRLGADTIEELVKRGGFEEAESIGAVVALQSQIDSVKGVEDIISERLTKTQTTGEIDILNAELEQLVANKKAEASEDVERVASLLSALSAREKKSEEESKKMSLEPKNPSPVLSDQESLHH